MKAENDYCENYFNTWDGQRKNLKLCVKNLFDDHVLAVIVQPDRHFRGETKLTDRHKSERQHYDDIGPPG